MATGGFLVRALVFWLVLAVTGVANGFLRQLVLTPWLGEPVSRPLSGITLIILIYLAVWVFLKLTGPAAAPSAYWAAGFLWVALTAGFEIVLGTAMGMTLSELLGAYDLRSGNLWLVDMVAILVAPRLLAFLLFR